MRICTSAKAATSLSTTSENLTLKCKIMDALVAVSVYFYDNFNFDCLCIFFTRYYPAGSLGAGPNADIDEEALLEVETFTVFMSARTSYSTFDSCLCFVPKI